MRPSLLTILALLFILSCKTKEKKEENKEAAEVAVWETDFLDDFDSFDPDNWQDQRIWVNNELQCYVPDGEFGTREVSEGSLK
ncbi:MAG: glycoside hydrolase family 16 protein, partial [Flavobacteriaceae bacterium]|nr:glycoside hydrolase family 16 protein [Flavobacteriaceae bacterium]